MEMLTIHRDLAAEYAAWLEYLDAKGQTIKVITLSKACSKSQKYHSHAAVYYENLRNGEAYTFGCESHTNFQVCYQIPLRT